MPKGKRENKFARKASPNAIANIQCNKLIASNGKINKKFYFHAFIDIYINHFGENGMQAKTNKIKIQVNLRWRKVQNKWDKKWEKASKVIEYASEHNAHAQDTWVLKTAFNLALFSPRAIRLSSDDIIINKKVDASESKRVCCVNTKFSHYNLGLLVHNRWCDVVKLSLRFFSCSLRFYYSQCLLDFSTSCVRTFPLNCVILILFAMAYRYLLTS